MDLPDFLAARREHRAQVIKAGYKRLGGCTGSTAEWTLEELIGTGETTTVEFKCCLRKNLHTGERDPRIEHSALKTIVGFLNASGGTLIIGVADDGVPVGIQEDGNTERFYVRTGASTTELTPSQTNEYVGQRFRAGA